MECADAVIILERLESLLNKEQNSYSIASFSFWLHNLISPTVGAIIAFVIMLGGKRLLFFTFAEIRLFMAKAFSLIHGVPQDSSGERVLRLEEGV